MDGQMSSPITIVPRFVSLSGINKSEGALLPPPPYVPLLWLLELPKGVAARSPAA